MCIQPVTKPCSPRERGRGVLHRPAVTRDARDDAGCVSAGKEITGFEARETDAEAIITCGCDLQLAAHAANVGEVCMGAVGLNELEVVWLSGCRIGRDDDL